MIRQSQSCDNLGAEYSRQRLKREARDFEGQGDNWDFDLNCIMKPLEGVEENDNI